MRIDISIVRFFGCTLTWTRNNEKLTLGQNRAYVIHDKKDVKKSLQNLLEVFTIKRRDTEQ
jgi:hypothetical protein